MDTPKRAYNEGRLEDARRLLLEEYARKKVVRRLIQIDGHKVGGGDSVMHPDEDGHCLMWGEEYELRNIGGSPHLPVRVQVYEGANKQDVVTLLRKITAWVERDWDAIRNPGVVADDPPHLRQVK
jgi:hypothetical protein